MDTAPLKSFATSARTELIREVGARITAVLAQGSPERVERPRTVTALERAIGGAGGGDKGKVHVANKVAYTWFNRIIALRFMDANGYTGIGVVSPAADQVGQPEVLAAAKRGQVDVEVVEGTNSATITGLLNGTRQPRPGVNAQAEAYALLLADYCRYWNRAMPFMFEREGDYTELLIPANLLAEDSVLSRSVKVLTKDVCQDVEVIGWLYQFYISERKAEVFAGFKKNKKAGTNEIPAATQLFTPHWIVRYLVENSLGRLWMLNHPQSRLVDRMDYYIAPVDEEIDFLKVTKPEELTVIDPACGSGHMLTYAFDLLYAIYEEEGYTPSQIPGLILTNNLYGTEIDPRAGALAAFALTMKAAAKRKLFLKNPVEPNICVLDPISFSADELSYLVTKDGDRHAEEAFWNQFAEADTFGSLIQPDPALTARLAGHLATLDDEGDILRADALNWAQRAIRQAEFLLPRYSVAVANPPYMGSGNMGPLLQGFVNRQFAEGKADLFSAFIVRSANLAVRNGFVAMITMQSWMFIASFEKLRNLLLSRTQIVGLAHLGANAFDSVGGDVVSTTAFVLMNTSSNSTAGVFFRLIDGRSESEKRDALLARRHRFEASGAQFAALPGRPIAYWLPESVRATFSRGQLVKEVASPRVGMATGDNARWVRQWWEVSQGRIGRKMSRREAASSGRRWFPYATSGTATRWYGNVSSVVDWANDGYGLQTTKHESGRIRAHNFNLDQIFQSGLVWNVVTSGVSSFRFVEDGYLFDASAGLCHSRRDMYLLALMNSTSAVFILNAINPTFNLPPGSLGALPLPDDPDPEGAEALAHRAVEIARDQWDLSETSWRYTWPFDVGSHRISDLVQAEVSARNTKQAALITIESQINQHFAKAFDLQAGDLPIGRPVSDLQAPGVQDQSLVEQLISFAVGCMFGRYGLDEPGLILADQGATLQNYFAKIPNPTFTPDADNVIPIVHGDWFEDDIVERFRQFLRAAFGEQHFEENLRFVTKALGVKNLRDYFVKSFYKDHVQRYKKRPIYWLFSSPKGSFNALIYMHRYTPSTVSTVLTYLREYVTKLESALQQAVRAGNAKEADRLRKVIVELNEYEHDTLFPKASENVVIDLDDGVKANYPKFGAALKKIPGLEAASD
ncbi:BREX-1 system adenine-specific DNA-methyltransferase PglX [Kocuria sp. UCD-OTCP]|uniref:BREX-1 system adenine-specific DNA-methyltransferase PglX n=1 Tax=Kocuria sp. UCD-OTCP TaxID=1292021 RepID=UPI00037F738E|nr:BREX-1 system adenine-specific DNA-methyltransferase PglX [Kocuria sp. UCD-OTCP]EYT53902.1 restriction endonuclease [Kocuria sp. UCD-OTCP]